MTCLMVTSFICDNQITNREREWKILNEVKSFWSRVFTFKNRKVHMCVAVAASVLDGF